MYLRLQHTHRVPSVIGSQFPGERLQVSVIGEVPPVELPLQLGCNPFETGGILGAWLGVQLQGVWFNRFLAVVMVLVMLMMAGNKATKTAKSTDLADGTVSLISIKF